MAIRLESENGFGDTRARSAQHKVGPNALSVIFVSLAPDPSQGF